MNSLLRTITVKSRIINGINVVHGMSVASSVPPESKLTSVGLETNSMKTYSHSTKKTMPRDIPTITRS